MAPKPAEVVRFIGRSAKRIAVSVVGGVLVLGGLVMLVLPGPGLLVVVLGFAVLGTEYVWAAVALERTKRTAEAAARLARQGASAAARGTASAARGTTAAARAAGRKVTRRG